MSNDRLARLPDGRYAVRLNKPWSDGTVAQILSGQELLARLVVLVPPPRVHTVRYGVFAPRSKLRRLIVPTPVAEQPQTSSVGDEARAADDGAHAHRRRMSWAALLRHVFEIDVTRCPRCQQQGMQQISLLTTAATLRSLLTASEARATSPP